MRRLVSVALALGLLLPSLAGVDAGKGNHGPSTGIAVQSVSYDATSGKLTTKVRWNTRDLKRGGRDELRIAVYNDSKDPAVLRDRTVVATPDKRQRTYRIKLSRKQRDAASDGGHLTVVATHKHADDGGLFEGVWLYRLGVNATTRSGSVNCTLIQAGADLSGCTLSGANLSYTDLAETNFAEATMSATNLTNANLVYADLSDATSCQTTMPDGTIDNANR
ncbi:MAG: pentapeptide repeat-containing protein [Thermomicrobiales bacterium]